MDRYSNDRTRQAQWPLGRRVIDGQNVYVETRVPRSVGGDYRPIHPLYREDDEAQYHGRRGRAYPSQFPPYDGPEMSRRRYTSRPHSASESSRFQGRDDADYSDFRPSPTRYPGSRRAPRPPRAPSPPLAPRIIRPYAIDSPSESESESGSEEEEYPTSDDSSRSPTPQRSSNARRQPRHSYPRPRSGSLFSRALRHLGSPRPPPPSASHFVRSRARGDASATDRLSRSFGTVRAGNGRLYEIRFRR